MKTFKGWAVFGPAGKLVSEKVTDGVYLAWVNHFEIYNEDFIKQIEGEVEKYISAYEAKGYTVATVTITKTEE
jgi:hypothetical protein